MFFFQPPHNAINHSVVPYLSFQTDLKLKERTAFVRRSQHLSTSETYLKIVITRNGLQQDSQDQHRARSRVQKLYDIIIGKVQHPKSGSRLDLYPQRIHTDKCSDLVLPVARKSTQKFYLVFG